MARSNRLLLVGGVITLLGAALVLLVMLNQNPSSTEPTAAPDEPSTSSARSDEVATPAVQTDDEGQPIFDVPEGMEAVALTVDFQRSVAALPAVGDRVNVYGVFANHAPDVAEGLPDGEGGTSLPAVSRILADVQILAVTGAAHDSNGGAPTFVVALDPTDVEAALYVHTAESIYLSLVDEATEASPDTDGANAGSLQR